MKTETALSVISFQESVACGLFDPLRCQCWVMCRETAKAVAFDLQGTIKSRAHVLERDSRGQIDNLLRIEMPLEFLEDIVGNVNRAERHLLCIAERGALGRREQWILGGFCECRELLVTQSQYAATGSVDVYSENATDHLRRAQTDHPLQRRRCDLRALDRLLEYRHRERDARTVGPRLDWFQNLVHPPLHHPNKRLEHPAHLIFFDRLDTHWNKLRLGSPRRRGPRFVRLAIEDRSNRD